MFKSAVQQSYDIPHFTYPAVGLRPNPKNILEHKRSCCPHVLKELIHTSIFSAHQFNRHVLCELYTLAAHLQRRTFDVSCALPDKILATAFFEASTRTRLSFESAMLYLGGKVISVAEGSATSITKGETLIDIGQMYNSYADIVVMRHTEQPALQELATYLRIPLINGGNGSDEHPTQALADWYALLKWKPALGFGRLYGHDRIHLGIIGTPGSMRTVKSFLLLSLLFQENIRRITIISEMADPLGADVRDFCGDSPVPIHITNDLREVVRDLDVIYMNAITFLGDSYRTLGERFTLDARSSLKNGAVILHPLARKGELNTDLDHTPHNLYFNQADGAVFVRQALLLSIFDRLDRLPDTLFRT